MYDLLERPALHLAAEPGSGARNGLTAADARAIARFLDLPELGREFECILPGSSGVAVIDPATLRYQASSSVASRDWLTLAEAYASRTAGRLVLLKRGVLAARWWSRLRHVAGLEVVDVPALLLPDDLSEAAIRLVHGFALARALDHVRHPGDAVMFARRFAMDWCGLPQKATQAGLHELTDRGVLVVVGFAPGNPRPTPLYDLAPECAS